MITEIFSKPVIALWDKSLSSKYKVTNTHNFQFCCGLKQHKRKELNLLSTRTEEVRSLKKMH